MRLLIDGDILSKNGTRTQANGYRAFGAGTLVHIALAEKALGKKLPKGAEIHHVDEDKTNNNPDNLVICPNHSYHALLHARQRILAAGGTPGKQKICGMCKQLLPVASFVNNVLKYDGTHNNCRVCVSEYKKKRGLNTDKFDWKASLAQQYRRLRKGYTKRSISWL